MKYIPVYHFEVQDPLFVYQDKVTKKKRFGPPEGFPVFFKGWDELNQGFQITLLYRIKITDPVLSGPFSGNITELLAHLTDRRPSCIFKMEAPIKVTLSSGRIDTQTFFNFFEGFITQASVYAFNTKDNAYDIELVLNSKLDLLAQGKKFFVYGHDAKTDDTDNLASTKGITFKEVLGTVLDDWKFEPGVDYSFDLNKEFYIDGQAMSPAITKDTPFGMALNANFLTLDSVSNVLISRQRFLVQANESDRDFLCRQCEREGVTIQIINYEYRLMHPNESKNAVKPYVKRLKGDRGSYHLFCSAVITGRTSEDALMEDLGQEALIIDEDTEFPLVSFPLDIEEAVAYSEEDLDQVADDFFKIMYTADNTTGSSSSEASDPASTVMEAMNRALGVRFVRSRIIMTDKTNPPTKRLSPTWSRIDMKKKGKKTPGADKKIGVDGTAITYNLRFPGVYDSKTAVTTGGIRDFATEFITTQHILPASISVANYSEYTDHAAITKDFAPLISSVFSYRFKRGALDHFIITPQAAGRMDTEPYGFRSSQDVAASSPYGRGDKYYYGELLATKQDALRIAMRRAEYHFGQANMTRSQGFLMDARAGASLFTLDRRFYVKKPKVRGIQDLTSQYIVRVDFRGYKHDINHQYYDAELGHRYNVDIGYAYYAEYLLLNTTGGAVYRPEIKTPVPKIYSQVLALVDDETVSSVGQEIVVDEETKEVFSNEQSYSPTDHFSRYAVRFVSSDSAGLDKIDRKVRHALPPLRKREFGSDGNSYGGVAFSVTAGAEALLAFVDGNPDMPYINALLPRNESTSNLIKRVGLQQATYLRTQGGVGLFLVDKEDERRLILEVAPPKLTNIKKITEDKEEGISYSAQSFVADDLPYEPETGLMYSAPSYVELAMPIHDNVKEHVKGTGYGIRYGTSGFLQETVVGGRKTVMMTRNHYEAILKRLTPEVALQEYGSSVAKDSQVGTNQEDGIEDRNRYFSTSLSDEGLIKSTMQFVSYYSEKTSNDVLRPAAKLYPYSVPETEEPAFLMNKALYKEDNVTEAATSNPENDPYGGGGWATPNIKGLQRPARLEGDDDEHHIAAGDFTRQLGVKHSYRKGSDFLFGAKKGMHHYSFGSRYIEHRLFYEPRTTTTDPGGLDEKLYRHYFEPFWDVGGATPFTGPKKSERAFDIKDYFKQPGQTEEPTKQGLIRRFYGNRIEMVDGNRMDIVSGDKITYVGGTYKLSAYQSVNITITDDVHIHAKMINVLANLNSEYLVILNNDSKQYYDFAAVRTLLTVDMHVIMTLWSIEHIHAAMVYFSGMGDSRAFAGFYMVSYLARVTLGSSGRRVGMMSFSNFLNDTKMGLKMVLGGAAMDVYREGEKWAVGDHALKFASTMTQIAVKKN